MTLEESVERELKAIECLIPFPCKTRQYINNLKHQILDMRCCFKCKHKEKRYQTNNLCDSCYGYSNWELAE